MSAFDPFLPFATACAPTFWRGRMAPMDERKILISPDGLGRIAIVRRPDGMFCLYEHWRWSVDMQRTMKVEPVENRCWPDADYDRNALYEGVEPLPGLFGSVEEAEREARSKEAFSEAIAERLA